MYVGVVRGKTDQNRVQRRQQCEGPLGTYRVRGRRRGPVAVHRSMPVGVRRALVRANAEVSRRALADFGSHCGVMRPFNLSISLLPCLEAGNRGSSGSGRDGPVEWPSIASPVCVLGSFVTLPAGEPFCAADTAS